MPKMIVPLTKEQKRLVEKYYQDIRGFVLFYCRSHLPISEEVDDFLSVGFLTLTKCAQRFDRDKGVPFLKYCRWVVRGALIEYARGTLRKGGTCMKRGTSSRHYSIDQILDSVDRGESRFPDFLAVEPDSEIDVLAKLIANRALRLLSDEPFHVVRLRYLHGLTFLDIGKRLNRSEPWVWLVHKKAIEKLRKRSNHGYR